MCSQHKGTRLPSQAFHSGKVFAGAGAGAAIEIGFKRGSRAGFGEEVEFKF